LGRSLGLNARFASVLPWAATERGYQKALEHCVQEGDFVWDVGANVGHYSLLLAGKVGADGRVFAFEPSPTNFSRLKKACKGVINVQLLEMGLGEVNNSLSFQQGTDDLGATSRVIGSEGGGILIDVRTAESLIKAGEALMLNAVIIDVEGFEYEVLKGFGPYLGDRSLRVIGIEVHFSIVKSRGLPQVPALIERLLELHGFKMSWPDFSHIIGIRSC